MALLGCFALLATVALLFAYVRFVQDRRIVLLEERYADIERRVSDLDDPLGPHRK